MSTIAKATHINNNSQAIVFHGQSLLTLEHSGRYYTAMKPICENIGLAWSGQRQRINRDEVLAEGARVIRLPSEGGQQDTLCLPIDLLNGWLFGVDSSRVKAEIKSKLIMYKKECYQVLHDYWHGKTVESPNKLSTVADRKPLSEAVNLYCAKTGSIHSDVWKLVHQRFALDDVYGMTVKQVPLAVEYVHSLLIQAKNIKQTPISSFTHNQYIMNVKRGVMDYVYSLQKAIVDSGSPLPKYPAFDTEEICQAFIVSMIRHNRMVLSFGYQDKPTVSFIPDQHAVVSSENIADVVHFADKAQLPSIINEAVKRLGK